MSSISTEGPAHSAAEPSDPHRAGERALTIAFLSASAIATIGWLYTLSEGALAIVNWLCS